MIRLELKVRGATNRIRMYYRNEFDHCPNNNNNNLNPSTIVTVLGFLLLQSIHSIKVPNKLIHLLFLLRVTSLSFIKHASLWISLRDNRTDFYQHILCGFKWWSVDNFFVRCYGLMVFSGCKVHYDCSFNLCNGFDSANDEDFCQSQIANLHFILRHISFN